MIASRHRPARTGPTSDRDRPEVVLLTEDGCSVVALRGAAHPAVLLTRRRRLERTLRVISDRAARAAGLSLETRSRLAAPGAVKIVTCHQSGLPRWLRSMCQPDLAPRHPDPTAATGTDTVRRGTKSPRFRETGCAHLIEVDR